MITACKSVHIETAGAVMTVILHRPDTPNVIDRTMAAAFADFENNEADRVAMLLGAPRGPTRMRLSKPVIAAVAGQAVGGGDGAGRIRTPRRGDWGAGAGLPTSEGSSAYEQFNRAVTAAMENEFVHGMRALVSDVGCRGAALFAAGEGSQGNGDRTANLQGIK